MPQADFIVTVPLETAPSGIFAEISSNRLHLVDTVHTRLDQITDLLFLLKNSEELSVPVQNALGAIETAVGDAAALLSVCGQ